VPVLFLYHQTAVFLNGIFFYHFIPDQIKRAMKKDMNKAADPNKGPQQGKEKPGQGYHDRKNDPVADNNPTSKQGKETAQSLQERSNPSRSESSQAGEWKRPLTNQDEQQKPTNAGEGDDAGLTEEQTEGDRRQDERLRPYKNVGDDSEEVEKKTPSME
jgi:hypothetical protein